MKKLIYALPINEAFDKDCACPLCEIENKLNTEAVEYTLGAAMMEPDFRIITNKKGFCKNHFSQLIKQSNALSLALIMQSQSEFQNKNINKSSPVATKRVFGKSPKKQAARNCVDVINNYIASCAICDKIEHTMDKFVENTIFLWKSESEFKEKFNGKSFCLPHFSKLVQCAIDMLGDSDFELFYKEIFDTQSQMLNGIYGDVSEFTKLFDHRSSGNPSPKIKTALKRCIHIYSSYEQND